MKREHLTLIDSLERLLKGVNMQLDAGVQQLKGQGVLF
jgi:hypothetical protein